MLDAEKIGTFIAQIRKEKNLTQGQLAEKLGVSDKTVSKWERGRGLPDSGILLTLSQTLSVDVNELLSGERLSPSTYPEWAEKNVVTLIEQVTQKKQSRRKSVLCAVAGIVLMCLIYLLAMRIVGASIYQYLDWAALAKTVLLPLTLLLMSGNLMSFFQSIAVAVGAKRVEDQAEATKMHTALRFGLIVLPLCSVLLTCMDVSTFLIQQMDERELQGSVGVALLPVIFSLMLEALLLVVDAMFRRRTDERALRKTVR